MPTTLKRVSLFADTRATGHVIPDKSTFKSYCPCSGQHVCMGNNLFAPILGLGTAIISLNGNKILIRDCLHVPTLQNPLYSLRAYQQCQKSCGFLGLYGMGMFNFFPLFILEVDTAVNCHLSYEPLGCLASLSSLNYVQHISTVLVSTTPAPPLAPAWIEPDDNKSIAPTFTSHWPKKPQLVTSPIIDLSLIAPHAFSVKVRDLDRAKLLRWLYLAESTHSSSDNDVSNTTNNTNSPGLFTNKSNIPSRAHTPLERMTRVDIMAHLHHPGTTLLPVCPSNCRNVSDTKSLWMP